MKTHPRAGNVPVSGALGSGFRVQAHQEFILMFRKFFAALVAVALVVGGVFADEVKGIFKSNEGGKLVVEVDGKAKEFKTGEKFKLNKKIMAGDKVVVDVDGETAKSVKKDGK